MSIENKKTGLILLAVFGVIGIAPGFGADREPTEHSYDFVRSICDGDSTLYECGMDDIDGQQCLVAYCVSGDHAASPVPWYYSCPEKST